MYISETYFALGLYRSVLDGHSDCLNDNVQRDNISSCSWLRIRTTKTKTTCLSIQFFSFFSVSKYAYDALATNERGVSDVIFSVVGRWSCRSPSDRRLAVKSNSARRNQYVTSLWTSLVSTTTHRRVSFRYVLRSLAIDRNPIFAAIFHKRLLALDTVSGRMDRLQLSLLPFEICRRDPSA